MISLAARLARRDWVDAGLVAIERLSFVIFFACLVSGNVNFYQCRVKLPIQKSKYLMKGHTAANEIQEHRSQSPSIFCGDFLGCEKGLLGVWPASRTRMEDLSLWARSFKVQFEHKRAAISV